MSNNNFETVGAVRAAADKMVDDAVEASNARASLISDVVKLFEGVDLSEMDNSGLAALLSLDDDAFKIIAPIFIAELQKALNNANDKLTLVQMLNAGGTTVEDLRDEYDAMLQTLETANNSEFSQPKIDFLKELIGTIYNMVAETEGVPHRIVRVPIELDSADAKIPAYAHVEDAGMDVYALDDITIAPGETVVVHTGIKVALPTGYELQVRPKSGRCLKTKLRVANTPGTIDAGYRDEIGILIENIEPPIRDIVLNDDGTVQSILYGSSYTIGKGEKFAQLVLSQVVSAAFYTVESVSNIGADRHGGFGSTGLK